MLTAICRVVGEDVTAAAEWWAAMDEQAAGLLAVKCHAAATVELREEAAEPLRFSAGKFAAVFLENLLQPLSTLPQLCVGRWRRNLIGKSYLPATNSFAADDELLWALRLTRTGFGSSNMHSVVFGSSWPMTIGIAYCGFHWWDDAPTRYFSLLVLIFQFLLRSQWAMKYAYRRTAAEQRLQGGTSLDRRAEELLFGFGPLAPWLCIVELRLAALAEGVDLDTELVFQGGAAEAEAMFPKHVMRWLPDALCKVAPSSEHTDWVAGLPKVHAERGEFSVTAAAIVYRALVHHSKVTPINGQPPIKTEFHSIDGAQDFMVLLCLLVFGMVPFAAAAIEGYRINEFSTGAIIVGVFYFLNAPFGVRGFLNAVFVNIRRRTQQQELIGALLSGQPSIAGRSSTPRLVHTEQNIVAWLSCRAVLLRSFASVQRRTEAMAAIVFLLCIGLFAAVAIPALSSEERIPLHGNAFLLLLTASLIVLLGSFAVAVSIVGDKFNHLAGLHEKELGRYCLKHTAASSNTSAPQRLETTCLLAQGIVRTTQETEPLSVLGLIELDMSSAKAVLFFMTVDLGIVFSRVDWGT